MPEDDVIAALGGLTPAARPGRDELLFAAGRASVRPARGWKFLAIVLAVSQAVTLAVWAGRPPRNPEPPAVIPALIPTPAAADESYVRADLRSDLAPLRPAADPAPPGPALRAGGTLPDFD